MRGLQIDAGKLEVSKSEVTIRAGFSTVKQNQGPVNQGPAPKNLQLTYQSLSWADGRWLQLSPLDGNAILLPQFAARLREMTSRKSHLGFSSALEYALASGSITTLRKISSYAGQKFHLMPELSS
jgi:hypothetical protein